MAPTDVLTHIIKKQQTQGILPAPPGVTPNFAHPTSHGHYLSLASMVCVVLAAIFVFARLWVKLVISHAPGWDDVTAVLALIWSLGFSIMCIISVNHWGLGHHLWEVPITSFKPFLQASIAEGSLYGVATYFAKLTIGILLLRIFGVDNRFRLAAWILIVTWTFYLVIGNCLLIFRCRPIKKSWEPQLPGHCLDITRLGVGSGYVYIVYDFLFILLPIPMVWQLQLARKLRLAVISIFLTGIFAMVASIIRQVEVVRTLHSPDVTWNNSNNAIWLIIETNVSIICGCMPVLRPLFSRVLDPSTYNTKSKSKTFKSTDYKPRISKPRSSAPGKSGDESALMDASYIELGPPHNHHANVSANSQPSSRHEQGILKTQAFGTEVAYRERDTF